MIPARLVLTELVVEVGYIPMHGKLQEGVWGEMDVSEAESRGREGDSVRVKEWKREMGE